MTRTLSITTPELRTLGRPPLPIRDFGIDRAEAARLIESAGLASPKRSTCGWTPRSRRDQPDEAVIRHLLLGPVEARLRTLGEELGLRGQTHRIVALAMEVALQGLRWPVEPGTRLVSEDGRRRGVVVGVKPAGFLEDWQSAEARRREMRGERFARSAIGQQEALVWTVDPSAAAPGISQGRLSDWKTEAN